MYACVVGVGVGIKELIGNGVFFNAAHLGEIFTNHGRWLHSDEQRMQDFTLRKL